jgi:hypothetical protein
MKLTVCDLPEIGVRRDPCVIGCGRQAMMSHDELPPGLQLCRQVVCGNGRSGLPALGADRGGGRGHSSVARCEQFLRSETGAESGVTRSAGGDDLRMDHQDPGEKWRQMQLRKNAGTVKPTAPSRPPVPVPSGERALLASEVTMMYGITD